MKKSLYILLFISSISLKVSSQDWHFSQFDAAPILVNPAAAGSYQGDYRGNLNYRSQWSSISNPFTSMSASFDMPALRNYNGYKLTGLGVSLLRDKAGKSGYGFTQANINVSQSIGVSKFQEISLGLSFGYGQVAANLNDLRWDSQYNGSEYDASLPTNEGLYFPKSNYFDISAGLLFRLFSSSLNETQIGISGAHLNRPWQATLSDINDDVLRMKFIIHGKSEIPWTQSGVRGATNTYFIPSLYYARQSASMEAMGGVSVKTTLGLNSMYTGYFDPSYYYIGAYYRYEDAFIAYIGYEWRSLLKVGLSYDINFSLLTPASSSRGGFEISLTWLGSFGFNSRSVNTIRSNGIR